MKKLRLLICNNQTQTRQQLKHLNVMFLYSFSFQPVRWRQSYISMRALFVSPLLTSSSDTTFWTKTPYQWKNLLWNCLNILLVFAWNSLSSANTVAPQVSLPPRTRRLSVVLIWSFHPHGLNMGDSSNLTSNLFSCPQRARKTTPSAGHMTSLQLTITNQSHAWRWSINKTSFPPSALFFTVWSDFHTALFRGEFKFNILHY